MTELLPLDEPDPVRATFVRTIQLMSRLDPESRANLLRVLLDDFRVALQRLPRTYPPQHLLDAVAAVATNLRAPVPGTSPG